MKKLLNSLLKCFIRIHRWLLPDRLDVGCLPYVWLAYCGFLFLPFLFEPLPPIVLKLTLISLLVFLPLYFIAYRVKGHQLKLVIATMVMLGFALSRWNTGASVYFIHASAFCALTGSPSVAFRNLGLIILSAAIAVIVYSLHPSFLGVTVLVSTMVGISNIFFIRMDAKNKELRQSQDEVKRLAATAERERIARDLHDLLGHTLSTITLKSALAHRLVGKDVEKAAMEMKQVEGISRDALTQVRHAVAGYRGSSVLNELISSRIALDTAGIVLKQNIGELSLPAEYENILGLILREALTNVVRHSSADYCCVDIVQNTRKLKLSVIDNGKVDELIPGSGLNGMRERVEAVNGTIGFMTEPGFEVHVEIPVPDEIEVPEAEVLDADQTRVESI